jgi:hypothetical protein
VVDVIFAFDVEDPLDPADDDATLQLCRIFTEEEVPVSLFIAGEKARMFRQRGRYDVIEALRPHEICYHGNYWAEFPEAALEYGQRLPWDEAVRLALSIEAPGLHDVSEITGQFPVAWCCPARAECGSYPRPSRCRPTARGRSTAYPAVTDPGAPRLAARR